MGLGGTKPVVEHVWSTAAPSGIFADLFSYFLTYGSSFEHTSSIKAVVTDKTAVRVYHRPHLEKNLVSPCCCVIHHGFDDPDPALRLDRNIDIYSQSDLLICLNTTQKKLLSEAGFENLVVIPHGFNPALTKVKKLDLDNQKFRLGLFSRRYARRVKGEAFLYDLAERLDPTQFSFLMIGEDRDIDAAYLSALGFDVEALGKSPYNDIINAYSRIHALLILSISEGGPASAPEAIAAGVPIISRPVGMICDLFKKAPIGLVLSDNPDYDASRITVFCRENLREAGHAIRRGDLVKPWRSVISEYENAIAQIL